MLTEITIRKKILELIWSVCTDAKRIRRNPFTKDRSEWAGLFRHEITVDNVTKTVTHAWIVRRAEYDGNVKAKNEKMTFELLGFYGFDFGTEESNSEDRFQKYLDDLVVLFKDEDIWEFEGEEDEVTNESFKFNPIGLIRSGNEFLHFAGGKLTVNIFRC